MATILVVDDEPINVKILKRLLTAEGFEVIEAANGEEAVALAGRTNPDLILMDVMMPGMDGFEATRFIKAREASRFTPVVMVTALSTMEDKVKGIEAGADDFLTKPYDAVELLARTRSLLKVKSLNDQVNSAYTRITQLNTYTDLLFGSFDAATFDIDDYLAGFLDQILSQGPGDEGKPAAVFLAVGSFNDQIKGRIYLRAEGRITARPEEISLPADSLVAFSDAGPDVAFSNWQETAESVEEYQEFFDPQVRGQMGKVYNYASYYFGQVAIIAFNYPKRVGPYDAQVLRGMAAHSNFLKTVADQVNEIENAFFYTIEALARAAEANDVETGNHTIRVNAYAALTAQKLGQPPDFVRQIGALAQMHDVGKIHIHPNILRKPGQLTTEEWEEIKRHTVYGAEILGDHPQLEMTRLIALQHHEHYDGSGYPHGLRGEDISLAGRIVILADIYDALRSQRPYKPAFSRKKARDIILTGDPKVEPTYFDPQILEAFSQHDQDFDDIHQQLADEQ